MNYSLNNAPEPSPLVAALHRVNISVVLPVYNHADYVAGALRSIFDASSQSIEVILVNDGSTDNLEAALSEFKNEPRLRLIHQTNRGLSHALNRGFREAKGCYLSWTSADNKFLPRALDEMADFLHRHPEIGLTYANVRLINESGQPFTGSTYRVNDQLPSDSSVLRLPSQAETLGLFNDNFINACFLFRRSALELVGGHSQSLNGFEDYDFWLRLWAVSEFAHLDSDEPLYLYRLHERSLTHTLELPAIRAAQARVLSEAALLRERLKNPDAEYSGEKELAQLLGIHHCSTEKQAIPRIQAPNRGALLLHPAAELHFRHENFLRYLYQPLRSAILAEPELEDSAVLRPRAWLAPPLRLPGLIRRARHGHMGAITPAPSTLGSLLYFCPDESSSEEQALLVSYISRLSQYTWALLARTAGQRAFADAINLALSDKTRLRILDFSKEPDFDWETPSTDIFSDAPWQERSLLYALSSADAVVSIKSDLSKTDELLELRQEAALAALAGLPVICFPRGKRVHPELGASVLDMPHLCLLNIDDYPNGFSLPALKHSVLDAWLSRNSLEAFRRSLFALLYAKGVEA